MAEHFVYPQATILPFIDDGRKDLEIRVADAKRRLIMVGDTLVFVGTSGTYRRKVKAIRTYTTFSVMLHREDPERIMPGYTRSMIMEGLLRVYPPDREDLGVLVFELEVGT